MWRYSLLALGKNINNLTGVNSPDLPNLMWRYLLLALGQNDLTGLNNSNLPKMWRYPFLALGQNDLTGVNNSNLPKCGDIHFLHWVKMT